ncbi:type II secretion system protein GspL [Yersinia hibernica]|uniref:General secretion pathway protein GspL n=1 Tax=Yersinia enterocolitica LC20 TaxID=1443113 RepID=A0A7U4GDA4_YEREN|nr:type II secretion system protein GspL [Yersinia hibernica]AHM72333.1 general secretion pathway protein GspL [Yersinia hibernica]OVZ90014.1 general secretion pathway protein GspL [Yersinia kristensenii]
MNNSKSIGLLEGTLIIRFGSHVSDPIYWYTTTEEGKNRECGRIDNHAELNSISSFFHYDVKILVSSSFIIFRKIKLINKEVLNKECSIAFSMEPTIVSNIDGFHIVVLKSDNYFCYVTAVEHELMSLWLGWLEDVGIYTSIMIPDVLTLPFDGDNYFSIKLDNEWLTRDSEVSGFVLRDNIFKRLCLSSCFSGDGNTFNPTYSDEVNSHSTNYCDVLRIMVENIENSNANLLSGRYNRHNKQMIKIYSFSRTIYLFFLLSIFVFLNSWCDRSNILRDIYMLNEALQIFHAQYPLLHHYMSNDNINYGVYSQENGMVKPGFISLLHAANMSVDKLDVILNSIYFSNEYNKVIFNIDGFDRGEMLLNVINEENKYLNVSETSNDDRTSNVIFECCL